jgi:hypothetical protein
MTSAVEVSAFLERVRLSLDFGFYLFTRKSRRELASMERDLDWGLQVLGDLTADDWYRDEAPWNGTGNPIRVFCPQAEVGLWIRLREEDQGFVVVISFHPSGEQ